MILAPVVAGRKGEQADLLDELRAQGFTRVRVDGKVHELDAAPRLAKNVKHTVDVVVDRLRARADAKQRLAESFETALRHADGRAIAARSRTPARSTCSRRASPARRAATRSPSSSRACSRSTTRWAPARAATAWARSSSSIRSAWSRTPNLSLASGAIRDRRRAATMRRGALTPGFTSGLFANWPGRPSGADVCTRRPGYRASPFRPRRNLPGF